MSASGAGGVPRWGAIVLWLFAVCLAMAIGGAVMGESSLGQRALDEGVEGTFTATHSEAAGSKGVRRIWVGTFTSDDGETTASDVRLRENVHVGESPRPDDRDAYLIVDPATDEPVAYAADYDTGQKTWLGIVVMAGVSLVATAVLIAYWVRRRRRLSRPQPAAR